MILIQTAKETPFSSFRQVLPRIIPIGVGYLLLALEQRKINVRFINERIGDNAEALVAEYVKQSHPPYIFAFSVMTPVFKSSILLSQKLKKKYPDSFVIFGGIHATSMPEEVLSFEHIDVVVRGEGEDALVRLYECIKNKNDFTGIDNISFRKGGTVVHNRQQLIADLDKLSPFPYHLFKEKRYNLGVVLGSRGCPHECVFCSANLISGKRIRYRAMPQIVEELAMLFCTYGVRRIAFLEDSFSLDERRVQDLISGLKREGIYGKVSFFFNLRADSVRIPIMRDLFDAGFRSVFIGGETISESVMKLMKKGQTVRDVTEAMRIAKKIGFQVSSTFIYGSGETHADRMNCVRIQSVLKIDEFRYNVMTPYPGTALYRDAKNENRLNVVGLYENIPPELFVNPISLNNFFKKFPLPYIPQGDSQDALRRDILFGWFSHYLGRNVFKRTFDNFEGRRVISSYPLERAREMVLGAALWLILFFGLILKFFELFYYEVINRETAVSFRHFLSIFARYPQEDPDIAAATKATVGVRPSDVS